MFGNWGLTNPGNPTDRSAIYASVKRHQGPLPFPPLYTPPPPADDDAPTPENPFSKGVPEDQSFYRFFQQIRRITDVTPAHFDALNISIQQNLPLDQVVEQRFIPVDDALPTDPAAEAAAAEPRTAEQRERDRWAPRRQSSRKR